MKKQVNGIALSFQLKLSIRSVWYCVFLWFMTFLVAGIVIIPWFYLAAAVVVFLTTVYYFKIYDPFAKKRGPRSKTDRDNILSFALFSALVWFLILIILSLVELAHFYYFDFMFYFSDFRNWYLFALVLLIPVIYGLVLENAKFMRPKRKKLML